MRAARFGHAAAASSVHTQSLIKSLNLVTVPNSIPTFSYGPLMRAARFGHAAAVSSVHTQSLIESPIKFSHGPKLGIFRSASKPYESIGQGKE